jgi:hypothetical protein
LNKATSLRQVSLAVVLAMTPAIVYGDTIPLVSKARPVFERALKASLAEIKKHGIAGLNGTLQDCYDHSMIKQDLKAVQYCFAMHIAAIQYDMAVIKSLGGEGSSSGMDLEDAFEMASPTLRRVGYKSTEEIRSVLQAWAAAFLAN